MRRDWSPLFLFLILYRRRVGFPSIKMDWSDDYDMIHFLSSSCRVFPTKTRVKCRLSTGDVPKRLLPPPLPWSLKTTSLGGLEPGAEKEMNTGLPKWAHLLSNFIQSNWEAQQSDNQTLIVSIWQKCTGMLQFSYARIKQNCRCVLFRGSTFVGSMIYSSISISISGVVSNTVIFTISDL